MRFIHATYNMLHNCIDVTTFDRYVLRIDCAKAEDELETTSRSEYALNALAIDRPLEYARLYLEGGMQTWVDAEDSFEPWQNFLSKGANDSATAPAPYQQNNIIIKLPEYFL